MDREYASVEPFDLALIEYYRARPDLRRYRQLVELGAEAGDPIALYAMATWFLYGDSSLGVRKDTARGIEILTAAARYSNRAMYDLAASKVNGDLVKQDLPGAYRLFARAAELGCLPAMFAQADFLRDGIGTRKDVARARALERRATALQRKLAKVQQGSRARKARRPKGR